MTRGVIDLGVCVVRPWRWDDATAIARHANSRAVWRNLRDRFPHPFAVDDAYRYLATAVGVEPVTRFCVEVEGEAAGSVGLHVGSDIERVAAEIGYWLGERYWSRGVMSAAVRAVTDYALTALALERVFATPFADNVASARVLERAGFDREGTMRRAAIKDGRVQDMVLYARVRPGAA